MAASTAGMVEATAGKSDGFETFITGIPIPVLPQSTRVRGSDLGWSATVGYRINRYFAGEFAYAEFGSVDIEETYDLSESSPFPSDRRWSSSTATRKLPVPRPVFSELASSRSAGNRFEAFVRGGVLYADQEVDRSSSRRTARSTFSGIKPATRSRFSASVRHSRTSQSRVLSQSGISCRWSSRRRLQSTVQTAWGRSASSATVLSIAHRFQ